jgi:hypothetical protein
VRFFARQFHPELSPLRSKVYCGKAGFDCIESVLNIDKTSNVHFFVIPFFYSIRKSNGWKSKVGVQAVEVNCARPEHKYLLPGTQVNGVNGGTALVQPLLNPFPNPFQTSSKLRRDDISGVRKRRK